MKLILFLTTIDDPWEETWKKKHSLRIEKIADNQHFPHFSQCFQRHLVKKKLRHLSYALNLDMVVEGHANYVHHYVL